MKNDLKNEARNKNSFGKGMSAISKETRLVWALSCNNANP